MEKHSPVNPDLPKKRLGRGGLAGGIIGSIGLAASILALSATASASGPQLQAQTTDQEQPTLEVDLDGESNVVFGDIDDNSWAEFEACVDAVFAGPEADFDFGPDVSIMDGDDLSFADFGVGDGSITISKVGEEITVTTDGDVNVEVLDFDDVVIDIEDLGLDGVEFDRIELDDGNFDHALITEFDNHLSGCEDQLPQGVIEGGFIDSGFIGRAEGVALGRVSSAASTN